MPKRGSRKKISTSYCHTCRLSLPSVEKLNQHIVEVHKNLPCSSGLSRASSSEVSTTLNGNISMECDEVREPLEQVLPRTVSFRSENNSESSRSEEMTSSELNSSINQSSNPDDHNISESISSNVNQASAQPHPNFSNLNCTCLFNHSDLQGIQSIQNQQPVSGSSFESQLNSLSESGSSLNHPFITSQTSTHMAPAAQQNVNTFEPSAGNIFAWLEQLKQSFEQFESPLHRELSRNLSEVKWMVFEHAPRFHKYPDDVKENLKEAFNNIITIHDYYKDTYLNDD